MSTATIIALLVCAEIKVNNSDNAYAQHSVKIFKLN